VKDADELFVEIRVSVLTLVLALLEAIEADENDVTYGVWSAAERLREQMEKP